MFASWSYFLHCFSHCKHLSVQIHSCFDFMPGSDSFIGSIQSDISHNNKNNLNRGLPYTVASNTSSSFIMHSQVTLFPGRCCSGHNQCKCLNHFSVTLNASKKCFTNCELPKYAPKPLLWYSSGGEKLVNKVSMNGKFNYRKRNLQYKTIIPRCDHASMDCFALGPS